MLKSRNLETCPDCEGSVFKTGGGGAENDLACLVRAGLNDCRQFGAEGVHMRLLEGFRADGIACHG